MQVDQDGDGSRLTLFLDTPHPSASDHDVAATLGYAGVSPFMRTFRRWAGTTPGQWRRAAALARLSRDAFGAEQHPGQRFDEETAGPRAA